MNLKRLMTRLRRPAQWGLYERYLTSALEKGYKVLGLEEWFLNREAYEGQRVLILRHDVDLKPASALRMARVEKSQGVSSTFYFRWSTADDRVIQRIKEMGSSVGLHYETLSRRLLVAGDEVRGPEIDLKEETIRSCFNELKKEVECFRRRWGPIHSIAAHGTPIMTRLKLSNQVLAPPASYPELGISFEAYDQRIEVGVDYWICDSADIPAVWSRGKSPDSAIAEGHRKILFNSHPHHWEAGWQYLLYGQVHRLYALSKPAWYRSDPFAFAWLDIRPRR